MKKTIILDSLRVRACTYSNLRLFYTRYEELQNIYHFNNCLIFNLDETSVTYTQKYTGKAICLRGASPPITAKPERMFSSTLVLCIPMEGAACDSTLIWPQAQIPNEFKTFCVRRIRVYPSDTAWQTKQSFEKMMSEYYIPEMVSRRERLNLNSEAILLIMDGHSSRLSLQFIRLCRQNNIIVLVLPSHTSSFTQPLDLGPNGILKSVFSRETAARINHLSESKVSAAKADSPSEFIKMPPIFKRSNTTEYYTQSAAAYRRLLRDSLPEALECATSARILKQAWISSCFALTTEERELYLKENLPRGSGVFTTKSHMPQISGKVLTDPETMLEIWQWRLSSIARKAKEGKQSGKEIEVGSEERKELEEEIRRLKDRVGVDRRNAQD